MLLKGQEGPIQQSPHGPNCEDVRQNMQRHRLQRMTHSEGRLQRRWKVVIIRYARNWRLTMRSNNFDHADRLQIGRSELLADSSKPVCLMVCVKNARLNSTVHNHPCADYLLNNWATNGATIPANYFSTDVGFRSAADDLSGKRPIAEAMSTAETTTSDGRTTPRGASTNTGGDEDAVVSRIRWTLSRKKTGWTVQRRSHGSV